MQSVAILSNCVGATFSSLVFLRCSTVLRRYFDISVPLRKNSSCLSSFKRQLEFLTVSTSDGRNLIVVLSSDTLKRKCPSKSVSALDVLETLGAVPPSHCLHDRLLCVTHPDHKHVSQSWRDSNCCEEKKWLPFVVNACCDKPHIARHVYLRFLSGTVTPSNVPLAWSCATCVVTKLRDNYSVFSYAWSTNSNYLNQKTSGRDTQWKLFKVITD